MYDILKTISGPEDVKKLSMDQLYIHYRMKCVRLYLTV